MTIKRLLPIVGQPDPSRPSDVHLVGRYALGVKWADDHSSIFPFERLRRDDPAGGGEEPFSESMTWPREIKRLPDALRVTWSDGHQSVYPYADLRAHCRCAACTGGH